MLGFYYFTTAIVLAILYNPYKSCARNGFISGQATLDAAGRQYLKVSQNAKKHQLTSIKWIGGNSDLSLAKINWNGQNGFLKCGIKFENELVAFKILLNAKDKLTGLNELGKYNVQQPLYRFNPDSKTLCFIYNYVKGRTLKDFIEMRRSIYDTSGKRSTFDEIALLAQIIPQVLKGIIYLHRAGVVHMDLSIMNIMVYQNQNTHEITATIVDYDSALPLGLIESKEIGAIAYANVMADVKLENFGSCSDDNDYITYIIGNLTAKSYVKKEFIESDGWKAYTRAVIQKQLDMRKETMSKRQMDLAIKRLLPLLKAAKHLIANNSNCATANQELSSITSSYANH